MNKDLHGRTQRCTGGPNRSIVGLIVTAAMLLNAAPVVAETADGASEGTSRDNETGIVIDENTLFGASPEDQSKDSRGAEADVGVETEEDAGQEGSLVRTVSTSSTLDAGLLGTEDVVIGGRYAFSATGAWSWDSTDGIVSGFLEPRSDQAMVDLATTVYLDARPEEDFRVFAKATLSYPFVVSPDADGDVSNGLQPREFHDVLHVDELFSDFNYAEAVFFRGGKHTINWGVGYYFSPADLLNITEIDPEDPEAEREGPVSLKAHYPFGLHNAYLYLIANRIDSWDEIGIAPKVELVVGPAEIGIGALYAKEIAPSVMLTVSLPLSEVDLFAEIVGRYGSDRTFVIPSDIPGLVETTTYEDQFFVNATIGFSYRYSFDEVDSSLQISGQYYYHDEGYEDPTILNNPSVPGLLAAGELTQNDLQSPGRHYAAASGGYHGLLGSDLDLDLLWIHNLTDGSGSLSPSLNLAPFEGFDMQLRLPFRYGQSGDQYTPSGESSSLELAVELGGGTF